MMKLSAIAIVALLLVGCEDPPPSPVGSWTGTSGTQTIKMTLGMTGSSVSGSGSITTPSGPRALTINGTFVSPTLSVTLAPGGTTQPINLTATMNREGTAMSGTLNGSGFSGEFIGFTR